MNNANTPTRGKLLCILLIFLFGCGSSDRGKVDKCAPQQHTIPAVDYNIYIENSGSMAGYLVNGSDFKKALINFISDIPARLKKEPNLFFVNSRVCPFKPADKTPLVSYIHQLTPATLKQLCPSNGSSLLPEVIDLSTTNMQGKVSILISDCIFSDKKHGSDLSFAEAEMKLFMSKKLTTEGNISTIVIKYNANFSGIYYTEANGGKPVKVNNINRPYYLLIFGKKENLTSLLQGIDFRSYPGYEASYCLSANDSTDEVYSNMTYKNKKGDFKLVTSACKMMLCKASSDKGLFQFSFNADLSQLGYEEGFLLDTNNYSVNDNFTITCIKKDSTYNITLKTTQLRPPHTLRLHLKYDPSAWIKQTGNVSDNNPTDSLQQHQTFGFTQLMTGIAAAYKANSKDNAFKLPIRDIIIKQ